MAADWQLCHDGRLVTLSAWPVDCVWRWLRSGREGGLATGKGGTMTTKPEELSEPAAEPRFTWLPLIPWALALAFGIAALGVGTVTGH